MKQKRILCINDISCMGKCSLTVALPIISILGIEAVVLPTALLSAHTVFDGYTFTDTTNEMKNILNHFDKMNEKFDCIYTGYLGSKEQVKIVTDFISNHSESLIITDPVMGDNGRLYSGFDDDFPAEIKKLCEKSDIIIPNLTEACLITNTPYIDNADDNERKNYVNKIAEKLSTISKKTVITGIKQNDNVCVYTAENNTVKKATNKKLINKQFHGTGDVFASTFAGAVTLGKSVDRSVQIATDFTELCIEKTNNDSSSQWYGLRFEPCLSKLINMI